MTDKTNSLKDKTAKSAPTKGEDLKEEVVTNHTAPNEEQQFLDDKEIQQQKKLEQEYLIANEQAQNLRNQDAFARNLVESEKASQSTLKNKDPNMSEKIQDHTQDINALKIDALKSRVNFLTFSLIIVIGAVALGGYYLDTHKNDKFEQIQAIANDVQENKELVINAQRHVDKVFEEVKEKDSRIDTLFASNADLKSQNNLLKNSAEELTKRVENSLDEAAKINIRLNNYEARNPNDWIIAQSFFLVSNAQNILSFTDNIHAAIVNLNQADLLLVKVDDPKITLIREKIIEDLLALKNVPYVDVRGSNFKLDSIYNNIDNMPLNEFLDEKAHGMLFKKQENKDGSIQNWRENLWNSIKTFSSRFIEVRRRNDTVVNEFLSPAQTNILLKNLKTELLLAKVALNNKDQESFNNNIAQISTHIKAYFDVNNEVCKNNLEALDELANTVITVQKPNELKSFTAFSKLATEYFHLYSAQKQAKSKKDGTQND